MIKNIGIRNTFSLYYDRKILLKLLLSAIFAFLMAISANTFLYLPFTPIPITTQVITLFVSSMMLGSRWAFMAQAQYILIGLLGAPVFAGFKNGISALAGPTGGFIIGFLFAAYVAGYIYETGFMNNKPYIKTLTACITGLSVMYLTGYLQLLIWLNMSQAVQLIESIKMAFSLGIKPFILFDFLKIGLVAVVFAGSKKKIWKK